MTITTKINKVTYTFSKESYNQHEFYALTKTVPVFKSSEKPKIQMLTCRPSDLPAFKEFLKSITEAI